MLNRILSWFSPHPVVYGDNKDDPSRSHYKVLTEKDLDKFADGAPVRIKWVTRTEFENKKGVKILQQHANARQEKMYPPVNKPAQGFIAQRLEEELTIREGKQKETTVKKIATMAHSLFSRMLGRG